MTLHHQMFRTVDSSEMTRVVRATVLKDAMSFLNRLTMMFRKSLLCLYLPSSRLVVLLLCHVLLFANKNHI